MAEEPDPSLSLAGRHGPTAAEIAALTAELHELLLPRTRTTTATPSWKFVPGTVETRPLCLELTSIACTSGTRAPRSRLGADLSQRGRSRH